MVNVVLIVLVSEQLNLDYYYRIFEILKMVFGNFETKVQNNWSNLLNDGSKSTPRVPYYTIYKLEVYILSKAEGIWTT